MFKSILGGIGRIGHQEKNFQVIKQIFKSLKNGGELLFIENMEGSFIHKIIRNKYGAGKNNWFYPSFYNFISYSRIFCKIKYKTFGIINVNTKNKNHRKLGELINYSLEKILPVKSRYIFAGVYQK